MCKCFPEAGPQNTDETLAIAFDYARSHDIGKVIVASTRGETGLKAAVMARKAGVNLIVVGHQYSFGGDGWEMPPDVQEKLRADGVTVHFATMPLATLRNVGGGGLGVVADTLRMFCQGMKASVEMALMCADAGLVTPGEDVVVVAGTHRGADTAVVIRPSTTKEFFSLRVRQVLAKPLT